MEAVASPLTPWETFYVIVGSSAAALTGLMFVVIALIPDANVRSSMREVAAFGTPTVVHFCAALLLSAILTAPWPALHGAGLAVGATGVTGVAYALVVVRRAHHQTGYKPVLEDWLWHAVFPLVAYAMLILAPIQLGRTPAPALFVIGGAVVLLLFIGIHNAWDTVTYIALERRPRRKESKD